MTIGKEIVSFLGFHRIDTLNRATSIGYWIAEAHQRRAS